MLKSPSGKCYIGQTTRPIHKRLEEHESGKSTYCRAIYNAIQKHGWDNFEKDWYECPDNDLNKHEELMMEVLGTLSPNGYNLMEGGGSSGKRSEETKQKMSEAHIGEKNHIWGKTHSKETIQKMSGENHPMYGKTGENNHSYGKTHSKESIQKMREAKAGKNHPMYGKTHTEETKQKNREAPLAEKSHWSGKTGSKHSRSKRIYQYNIDGTFIDSFGSSEEAGRYLNKTRASINACALGKRRTAHKFKWSYTFPFM